MTTSPSLTLLQAGTSPRLAPLLDRALEGIPCRRLSAAHLEELTPGGHLLFAVGMDAFGPGREFYALVRWLRQHPAALAGCLTAIPGALLASNLDTGLLRKLFGGFLVLVGISEVFFKGKKSGSSS